jgi:hypothetical protein
MGQWTLDYIDNLLHAKMTTLVSGAIQRATLDKNEPSITYENFVKDLDTGDSFTTTFIDILVREMAERRTRTNPIDRRLIADRTAKNLRLLATPLRVYRERPSRIFSTRRTVNLSDYLSAPPNEMDVEDDDDDFDPVLDSYPEGARLNQDLYDAYGFWSRRMVSNSPSPPAEENPTTIMRPPSSSAVIRHNPWPSSNPPSGTSLRRQSSIRLSSRSRTVDFNDFTSRRRTSIREAFSSRPDGNEGAGESRDRDAATGRGLRPTRRFFPFGRSRTHDSAGSGGTSSEGEAQNGVNADEGYTYIFEPSVSGGAAWFPMTSPARSASPVHDSRDPGRRSTDARDEQARHLVHRLRRGTIQAPESMFSRPELFQELPLPASLLSDSGGENRHHNGLREVEDTAAAYPTPGTTDNESSS